MGIEHYTEVQLNLPVWYPVTLHRRHLGDIQYEIGLDDQPTAPCARDYLDLWCNANTFGAWESIIDTHVVIWKFIDSRDAVLFKLTWGGQ